MSGWHVMVERGCDAAAHMAHDARLATAALATVRLFVWDPPAISLGYRQAFPRWLDREAWEAAGLESVERPTGGGMVFHGSDVSVSVVVPRALGLSLELLMRTICQSAARICDEVGADTEVDVACAGRGRIEYCLAEESPYAVFVDGKKMAGFALRRFPRSWLIQGSMLVRPLPSRLSQAIPGDVRQQLRSRAIALSEASSAPVNEHVLARRMAESWTAWWDETLIAQLSHTH